MGKNITVTISEYHPDARDNSWSRRLARLILCPFASSSLRPNHITTMRIATGGGACAALAQGDPAWAAWGGMLWIVSAFLDRCDGEFARMKGMITPFGKTYDFIGDVFVNGGVFIAIGFGQTNAHYGLQPLVLGIMAACGVVIGALTAEKNERGMANGMKTFNGLWGFDFDDLSYLIAPFAWFNYLMALLIGAALGGPLVALIIIFRLLRKQKK